MSKLIYLALPYTSTAPGVTEKRVNAMLQADVQFMSKGIYTVSPVYKHFVEKVDIEKTIPLTWDYWQDYAETLMRKCDEVYVLCVDGWKESTGVSSEIVMAHTIGLEVKYFDESLNEIRGAYL